MTALIIAVAVLALVAAWLLGVQRALRTGLASVDAAWLPLAEWLGRRDALVREVLDAAGPVDDEALAVPAYPGDRRRALTLRAVFERALAADEEVSGRLETLDEALLTARRIYNAEVRLYLSRRNAFPGWIFARFGDFPPRPYFELDHTRERAIPLPSVPVPA